MNTGNRTPSYLVQLIVLSLLAVCAIALLPGTAGGTAPSGQPVSLGSRVYLPNVIQLPTPTPTSTPTPTDTPTSTPTPTPTVTPSLTPTPPELVWDPRLSERGAVLVNAEPSPVQGHWRLVRGAWYAEHEKPFDGQHHIFVDTLDAAGHRKAGVRVRVTSPDGTTVWGDIVTELKPGELYAGNFPMYAVAPAYRVFALDGGPADVVTGLGLGSIEQPTYKIHTSYGFVWQWTVAPGVADAPVRPEWR